jgi:succinoglycan biosynthesis transport protein ExoP
MTQSDVNRSGDRDFDLDQASAEDLKFSDVLRFIRRRYIWLLLGAVAGLLLSTFYTMRAPRLYTASTTVELNKDASSGLGLQDLSGVGSTLGTGTELTTDLITHQVELENDNTALSVISDLNLMQQPPYSVLPPGKDYELYARERGLPLDQAPLTRDRALGIFKHGLKVELRGNTRLITVSYTDTDRVRGPMIANATIQAYLRNHTEARYAATEKASNWLKSQLEDLKRRVEESRKKVSSFEQSAGVVASSVPSVSKPGAPANAALPEDANSTGVQRLLALNAELSRAQVERVEREAIYHLTATNDPTLLISESATKLGTEGGALTYTQQLQNLRAQISGLRVRLAAEQVKFGSNYPTVVQIRSEIKSLEDQSAEEVGRINSSAKRDFEIAKAKEDAIRRSVEQQQQAVFALGNSLSSLAFLEQEESTSRGLYQDLYTRLEEANIAAGVRSTDMVVVDPARIPSQYSSPKKQRNLLIGLAIGSFAGLLFGLFQQLRDTTLYTFEEFERSWSIPMLGLVPQFKAGPQSKVNSPSAEGGGGSWILSSPKSKVAEAYRQIRTALLFSRVDRPPQVIQFASALSGEGKSTTAYNLAVAFSVQAQRVLLIDADMRRPTLKHRQGLQGSQGLSDLLVKDLPLSDVVQQHPNVPSLFLLAAGTTPPMPAELLGSQRFAEFIKKVRAEFDYVLIDGPPVLLVTDPLLIGQNVDGLAIIVRSGFTQAPALRGLRKILTGTNISVLGYILNGVDNTTQAYGYGYGYGYGGYYSDEQAGSDDLKEDGKDNA